MKLRYLVGLPAALLALALAAPAAPQVLVAPQPIPATYFGLHAQKAVSPRDKPAPWPTVPFGSFRLWSIPDWFQINGRPGRQYNFQVVDRFCDLAQQHGQDVMFTVGHTPRWASSAPDNMDCVPAFQPGGADPPKDLNPDGTGTDQFFRDFIAAFIQHSKGRIKCWEMWNEAGGRRQWTGTIPQLVRMTKDLRAIVKAADPAALILTPPYMGAGKDIARDLEKFLQAGGGEYVDVIAFHGYLYPQPPRPERLIETVAAIREVMQRHGQEHKPLWDTEGSWGKTSEFPDPDKQAAFLARMYLLHWSLGVERFYWFTWSHYATGAIWDKTTGKLTKAGVAYRQVYDWLVGATQTAPCAEKNGIWTASYTRPGGYQAQAVWSAAGSTAYVVPPQFIRARDLEGSTLTLSNHSLTLTPKPILLETCATQ